MRKRFSVSVAVAVLLCATALAAPQSVADHDPATDPADTWPPTNPPSAESASGSAATTTVTADMQREISRVVAEGARSAPVAPTADARTLATAGIRCATFEEQRYCLHYGWTDRTPAELRRDLVEREATQRTLPGERTGDASLVDSLRARARMSPNAQAEADRAELTEAARATAKVISLRHDIEGTPYPEGFFARHPEVDRSQATAQRSAYPERRYIMNWHHVREQRRSYWCGPTTMQMIAWGWQKELKSQQLWADRMGTTSSGTGIYSMVEAVNKYTGYDKEKYAGKYIVLDISDYSYHKWLRLNKRHYVDYRSPIVTHPVLDARYFDYLQGYSGSGHFQVGRGYNNRGDNPATIGLFEPWNPRRFNSSAPYVSRLQYHRAYMGYQANQAHPQQNIGV
ncbi:MAG: C39 family peptidase [Nocardioidaceae bacterium]